MGIEQLPMSRYLSFCGSKGEKTLQASLLISSPVMACSSDEDDDDAEEAVGAPASFQKRGGQVGQDLQKRGSSSSAVGGGRVRTGPVAPNGQGKSKAALAWSRKHGGREGRKDKGEGAANRLQKLTSKMKRGRGGKGRDGGMAKSKKKK